VVFASFFSLYTNFANTQSFYTKQYTVNDGLPASYIISVFQDSNGFLWLGTYNGLSRFDGKEFSNYGYESGMPHIIADAIFEDNQHRLWIGTRNGMAEVKGNHCVVYPWDDNLHINFVFKFYETRSGKLWALTGKGVYEFENDHWVKIKLYKGFENHACRDVIEANDEMLINYGHYLVRKNKDGFFQLIGQITYDDATGPFYNDLYQQNGLWYLNTTEGLYEINGKDTSAIFKDELRDKYILHSYKDRAGRFWVFTLNDQLMVSIPGNNQHFFYKQTIRLVSAFCEDREGNMWVACSNGLLKMKMASYERYEKTFKPSLSGICSVINTADNRLLVSAGGNSLFAISTNKNGFRKFPIIQSRPHHEIIDYWCNGDKGRTWMIFREDGDLSLLQNNQLKFLNGLVKGNIHPLTGVAYSMRTQKLYVCADTFQCGNEDQLYPFKSANGAKLLIWPICVHYFPNGRLLVGTRNDGFFIIDDRENIFPVSRRHMSNHDAAASTRIFEDPSSTNEFWMASSYGLTRYRWDEKMMPVKDIEITTVQGLPNNGVRSVTFDREKRIWAATLSGMVVIEINSSARNSVCVNRLSEEQGISSEYWTDAKLARDVDGNIWTALTNELLRFDPSKVQFAKIRPSIVINDVRLNPEETNWSQWTDSFQGVMQLPYKPVLPYKKNNIGISYKAISFDYTSAPEYSYRLMGSDTNWNISASNLVLLVNLSPGKYDFQVRARKSNSEWSNPAQFYFTIRKPYWSTTWFRMLAVVVIAAIAYLLYRYRIDQLKKLLAMRTKISRDLHDEVGSTLSGIGLLSEVAIQQLENEKKVEVKKFLHKINESSEEMLEKIGDIVWAVNPQNDSFEKIISRLKTYAKTTTDPLAIQLHFNSDKNVVPARMDMHKRKNIYLICKEAINNAVKYSECKNLSFQLNQQDHEISIHIADDGKGFDIQNEFEGNGLNNIKARAKEIKAQLRLESEEGKGTSLMLFLKIT
jgi:ligand-binding sensor domain-containing protein/two-component sensor histidine kinase